MDSIHFRLPHNITQIMDMATEYSIFPSRSGGLRLAATYAILEDTSAQTIYDNLVLFNDLVQEFKDTASYMIQESLVGNLDPLLKYMYNEEEVLRGFPMFWQGYLSSVLSAIPEHRVIESCLEIADNV